MEFIFDVMDGLTILSFVKLLIVIGLMVYVVFSFLMMRQIGVMHRAVEVKDGMLMRTLGAANFIAACLVLILALVAL